MNDDPPNQDKSKTVATGITHTAGRGRVAPSDAAFEIWLQQGLRAMYGDIAQEPVPPELLALIERDRNK